MERFQIADTSVSLRAHGHGLTWNGFATPRATMVQVVEYVDSMCNMYGSGWDADIWVGSDDALRVRMPDHADDVDRWEPCGTVSETGETLYELSGWAWEAEGKWDALSMEGTDNE